MKMQLSFHLQNIIKLLALWYECCIFDFSPLLQCWWGHFALKLQRLRLELKLTAFTGLNLRCWYKWNIWNVSGLLYVQGLKTTKVYM